MDQNNRIIDKTIPIPMFYQLKQILLDDMKSGTYSVGDMIPTEAELSATYDVSRATVRQAVLELVQEGYLTRTKGKGTFVAEDKLVHNFIQKIESFADEMNRLGRNPSTKLLDLSCVNTPAEVAKIMGISPNQKSIYLYRKRLADNEPIVTIKTYLSYERCQHLLEHDLENESLYKILSQDVATAVCKIERKIEASVADAYDAKLLKIEKGQAIHFFKSVGYAADNTVIEYSQARYRGDRSSFQITLSIDNK